MAFQNSRWQGLTGNDTADPETQFARDLIKNDPEAVARGALLRAFSAIDTKNKKRNKRVEKLKFLIHELYSIQPAELTEIAGSLGQSLNTTREQLQKLIKVDLVVRVAFEENTLYCINGHYNKFINDTLSDYYD
jgi:uncharacterized tellurite resistance protein B-like protein